MTLVNNICAVLRHITINSQVIKPKYKMWHKYDSLLHI